jgi:alanine-glyoxylate transaminase/serine-glyoxylate transaminase/serine-pyruvate transaminase
LYGLHEALRIILEEGLEKRFKRHAEAHARLLEGIGALGLELLVDPSHRLPMLNSIRIPPGVDDKAARKKLLLEHGVEISGGLGDLAGKIWRIGLMGEGARPEAVDRVLSALKQVLR